MLTFHWVNDGRAMNYKWMAFWLSQIYSVQRLRKNCLCPHITSVSEKCSTRVWRPRAHLCSAQKLRNSLDHSHDGSTVQIQQFLCKELCKQSLSYSYKWLGKSNHFADVFHDPANCIINSLPFYCNLFLMWCSRHLFLNAKHLLGKPTFRENSRPNTL